MEYLVIGLGGFLGANARYLVAGWATRRFGAAFPYRTFLINLSGSFLLGLLLAFLRERIFFVQLLARLDQGVKGLIGIQRAWISSSTASHKGPWRSIFITSSCELALRMPTPPAVTKL